MVRCELDTNSCTCRTISNVLKIPKYSLRMARGALTVLLFCWCLGLIQNTLLCHVSNKAHVHSIGLKVDCTKQMLIYIPEDLPDDVTSLILRDNYLVQVTADDLPYLKLRHLDLAFNNLTSIKPGTFSKL